MLAHQYVSTGSVAAAVLAGSLGRGRADAFSDVELDVYWSAAPSDDQRLAPTVALEGTVTHLWPYDHGDAEWSEDVQVCGVGITVSGFTTSQIDRWIRAVGDGSDPHLIAQMRLSALHEGATLHGEQQIAQWRAASAYPRRLAVAVARSFLRRERLAGWRHWRSLQHRRDAVMLHGATTEVAAVVLGTLCAVNRIYIEHPSFKWSRHLVERFERAPHRFVQRFFAALDAGPVRGAPSIHELLVQTVEIVEDDLPEVATSELDDLLGNRWP